MLLPTHEPDSFFPRTATGDELEIPRAVRARISWDGRRYQIAEMTGLAGGGVYIVEKDGKPLYVGEAASFRVRWRNRLRVFTELSLVVSFDAYRVRTGSVSAVGASRPASPRELRQGVERVLVRYLLKQKRFALTNVRVTRPFTILAPGVWVANEGSRPPYLPQVIRRATGSVFELARRPSRYRGDGSSAGRGGWIFGT